MKVTYNPGQDFSAGNPEFNDSIGYLRTIRWLINTAHISAANDGDYSDWLRVIQQLHIEIYPRLNKDEKKKIGDKDLTEQEHLEALRKDAIKHKNDFEKIREYHLWTNAYVHKHGLGMLDQEEIGDTILD